MKLDDVEENYNTDDTMACFRNTSHSVEQITVLITIWALKFESNQAGGAKQQENKAREYLKIVLRGIDCTTQNVSDDTLDQNLDEDGAPVKEIDCGLCKLMVYTKLWMKNCTNNILNSWSNPAICPFREAGISYLALKEIKEEVIDLHREKCCCPYCVNFVHRYESFTCLMSFHEQLHRARKDY